MENVLAIDGAGDRIKIDRAHRTGKYDTGKKRPIVVKFNFHQDKIEIKNKAREKLTNTQFRVSEQYPREIQERRKKLIPELIKEGKHAVLAYDKLYINGRLQTPVPGR